MVTSALTATVEVATSDDGLVSAARVDSGDAAVSAVLDSVTFSVECSVVVDSEASATAEVVVGVGAMVDSVSDSFTTFGSLKLSGCSVEDSVDSGTTVVVDVDSVVASVDVAVPGSSEDEGCDSDTSVLCAFSSISSDVELDAVDVDMVEDSEEAESTLSLEGDSSAVEAESVVELSRVSELERSELSVVDDSSTVDGDESVDAVSSSWTPGSVPVEGAAVVVKVSTASSALNCSSVSPSAAWSRPRSGTRRWIMWT